jgi:hypothetical protein
MKVQWLSLFTAFVGSYRVQAAAVFAHFMVRTDANLSSGAE